MEQDNQRYKDSKLESKSNKHKQQYHSST